MSVSKEGTILFVSNGAGRLKEAEGESGPLDLTT